MPPNTSLLKQSLLGSPSTTKIDIPLLSQFTFGTSIVNARLELGRSDGWRSIGTGQGRELSVLEATLEGIVRPKGIRYLILLLPHSILIKLIISFQVQYWHVIPVSLHSFRPSHFSSYPSRLFPDFCFGLFVQVPLLHNCLPQVRVVDQTLRMDTTLLDLSPTKDALPDVGPIGGIANLVLVPRKMR